MNMILASIVLLCAFSSVYCGGSSSAQNQESTPSQPFKLILFKGGDFEVDPNTLTCPNCLLTATDCTKCDVPAGFAGQGRCKYRVQKDIDVDGEPLGCCLDPCTTIDGTDFTGTIV
ncbi:CLUMA_CG003866, isoform A [Clunio marinus]|uniref:CLUMA_CG003866, isoform A n=1 Tax=Clunio marinus TaxID=568069 RepID=A0A1J1HUH2_9DIPT|nr:CLUMA_CG003866, isoform A [Clunio marinus]